MDSSFVGAACQSDEPGKRCELPRLKTSAMLPSSYWDALWYATVAEVKFFYSDIQSRFGKNFEDGDHILHSYGTDGDTMWKFTVKDLAVLLERCWMDLHHTTVIAALDYRVKQKNALKTLGHVPSIKEVLAAEGLINIDGARPEFLWRMLWEKFRPEMKQAWKDNVMDDNRLSSARSAMRIYSPKAKYGLDARHLLCTCGPYCHCRCICDFSTTGCSCEIMRQRIGCALVSKRKLENNEVKEAADKAEADRSISSGMVKAHVAAFENPKTSASTLPLNTKTRDEIKCDKEKEAEISKAYCLLVSPDPAAAAHDNAGPDTSQAYLQLVDSHPAAGIDDIEEPLHDEPHPSAASEFGLQPLRDEPHTTTAVDYVPPCALDESTPATASDYGWEPPGKHAETSATKTSSRRKATDPKTPIRPVKDANPLDFYGDYSGQRYPAEATFRAPPTVSPPVYCASLAPIAIPAAQPMSPAEPSPGSTSLFQKPIIRKRTNTAAAPQRVPVPVYAHDHAKYDRQVSTLPDLSGLAITAQPPQSSGLVNSSFPIGSRGNVREERSNTESTGSFSRYIKDSPPRHDSRAVPEPFPRLSNEPTGYRPFTTVFQDMIEDPQARAHAATAAVEAYNPTTPDYINPQPSRKQRWVSAGGNTPLHEREETPPPSLISAREAPIVSASALFSALDAVKHEQQVVNPVRVRSEENERYNTAERPSGDEDRPASRERQSTGTGKMSVKLRRMFKRSGSSVEQ